MLDLVSYLRRICNADANETFDPATDSLEALRDFIASTLGFGPGVSLWMFGRAVAGMAASQTVITTDNLGDQLPDDVFNDEFYITVIHNADVPGTAPEGEWRRIADFVGATQVFTTDAFSANVEEGDLLLIVHESIIAGQPQARGTLDTSSATVPADSARTEANDFFNGHLLVPTEGVCAGRATRIVDYDGATGTFTLDPNNPLPAVSGEVDYVIIKAQAEFVPVGDANLNRTPGDVVGNKTDTGITASTNTASLVRYLKGIMDSLLGYQGATSLANKLTAARASYLDELGAANIPADVDGLIASKNRQLFSMDFWSNPQEELSIPAVAATRTLPSVTVADLPAGATIVRAIAIVKFRMIENTNVAANKLDGATVAVTSQVIQVQDDTPGTWRDAINFVDDQFGLAATTRESGDMLIGSIDIAVEVDGNDTYEFQYLLAHADQDSLNWNDVQTGLRIWYLV